MAAAKSLIGERGPHLRVPARVDTYSGVGCCGYFVRMLADDDEHVAAPKRRRLTDFTSATAPINYAAADVAEWWLHQPAKPRREEGRARIRARLPLRRGRVLQLRPANARLLSRCFVPMDSGP